MRFSALHGVAAGAIVAVAVVAFVVHPAALAPHPAPSPALSAGAGDDGPRVAAPRAAVAVVYVAGAVAHPGVYALAAGARAGDAVNRAGGLTRDADSVAVNLAAHVADGDEIAVPRIGETAPAPATDHHRRGRGMKPSGHRSRRHRAPREADGGTFDASDAPPVPIDLNSADAATLATIPGIGETLAERIVDFRTANGPFATVDALADVSGITATRFDAIAAYLTVRP